MKMCPCPGAAPRRIKLLDEMPSTRSDWAARLTTAFVTKPGSGLPRHTDGW